MDHQSCRKLIKLYGTKELLWNSKSSFYHKKALREDAWREISSDMGVPVPELKKKMTVLLSSYRREKWRMSKSQITGSGRDSVYISKWFGFNDFSFMQDKCTPNDTIDTMQFNSSSLYDTPGPSQETKSALYSQNIHGNSSESDDTSEQSWSYAKPQKRKTTDSTHLSNEVLHSINSHFKRRLLKDDRFDIFGKSVAIKLRDLSKKQRLIAEKIINDTLFQAEMGNLTLPQNEY